VIVPRRGLIVTAAACVLLAGCTTAGQLLFALVPDGTIPLLLGKLERESDTNRRQVAELERKGDWEGLAKFADDNIAKGANNSSWWLVAGYANSKQKKHARAIECFQEIVRLDPTSPDGWNLLAQEHRTVGDSQRAVDVLTRALTALRDFAQTLTLLGESYSDLSQFELAGRAYRQALDIDGGSMQAWAGLARSHIKLGRMTEAESVARAVEKFNPPNPQLAAAIRNEISVAASK
jgi:tetratricopeptide (TPR) repeat protein